MITIYARPGDQIELGHCGENLARQVVFDIKSWVAEFGASGKVVLVAHRPQDEYPYLADFTRKGSTVYWPITNVETLVTSDPGSAELQYLVNNVVVKSMIWKTHVAAALGEPTERPKVDPNGSSTTKGKDGVTFIPFVDKYGTLSWTNDGGLPNPPPVNIRGPKGESGVCNEVKPGYYTEFGPFKGLDVRAEAPDDALTQAFNVDGRRLPLAIAPIMNRKTLTVTANEGAVYHGSGLYLCRDGELFYESGSRACALPSGAGYQRTFLRFGTTLLILPDAAALYQNGNLLRLSQLPAAAAYITAHGRVMAASGDWLYVSALGDCGTWTPDASEEGAWRLRACTGGDYTGGVTYNGVPHFFKPDSVTKLFGTKYSDFEPVSIQIPGVKAGCGKSVAVCHGVIYYYSNDGVMAYDGYKARLVSQPLGEDILDAENVIGGVDEQSYWVYANSKLFRFDGERWAREEPVAAVEFVNTPNGLLARTDADELIGIGGCDYGEGTATDVGEATAQIGPFFCKVYGKSGLSGIVLRMKSTGDPTVIFSYRYDSGDFVNTNLVAPNGMITVEMPEDPFSELTMKLTGGGDWLCAGIWLEPREEE